MGSWTLIFPAYINVPIAQLPGLVATQLQRLAALMLGVLGFPEVIVGLCQRGVGFGKLGEMGGGDLKISGGFLPR